MRRSNLFVQVILLLIAISLSACATTITEPVDEPAAEPTAVSVRLKWLHQVQFAGLYMAEHEGYYSAENLDVTLEPVDMEQQVGIDKVLAGENDFGVAAPDEILIALAEGKPIRALAVHYRISPSIFLVTPDSGIQTPRDFLGQTVALSPGSTEVIYAAMLENLGVDRGEITEVPVTTYDLWECWESAPVCPNYATNGPPQLEMAGEEYTVIWPSDYGVSWYGDVLFTTEEMIAEQPEVVAGFVKATLQGWQAAIEDPDLAVTATLAYNDQLDVDFQSLAMRASIPLIDTGDAPIGQMDAAVWQAIQELLLEYGFIDSLVELDEVFTNEFVTSD
jgi:NitT/TauT family transport system substrate-binding protein